MIHQIDDDWWVADELSAEPQNIVEHDLPALDWCECPMLSRGDMLAVIERQKDLDGRAINLFKNALQREPRSDLFRHYIGPHLYHPGSHYIYTTPDPSRYGFKNWRPEITALAIENCSIAPCGLFSNTLSWIDEGGLPPGERTYNAGFAIYTFEPDFNSLEDQLRVIYSGRLKRIDAELRRYRDYRGYEVVYSGGKSLHFHLSFDLRHLKRNLAVNGNSSYQDNWRRDPSLSTRLRRTISSASTQMMLSTGCNFARQRLASTISATSPNAIRSSPPIWSSIPVRA